MSDDYLKDFLGDDGNGICTRQVIFGGKAVDVHFRRLSDAQKSETMKGQKVQAESGKSTTIELDLSDNAHGKAVMVFYSVVHPDGRQYFRKLADVRNLDAGKVQALYLAA